MRFFPFSGVFSEGSFDESDDEDLALSASLVLEALSAGVQFLCCHCGRPILIEDFIEGDMIIVPQLALELGYLAHGSCLRVWLLRSDPLFLAAISAGARPEDLLKRLQSMPFESILLDLRRAYGSPPQEAFDRCSEYVEGEAHLIEDRCTFNINILHAFLEEYSPTGDGIYPDSEDYN
ncbi:MAG: hypothetical protein ACFFB3_05325 [Candidatus Hodarchaeota archaeon]